MTQGLSIWSRVVLAQLNDFRTIRQESSHILDASFKYIEEVKVKIKDVSWKRQGKAVETLLKLELLFLLEDQNGNMKLMNQESSLRDRVPFSEFDADLDLLENDKMIGFNGEIRDLSWQVDINDLQVKMLFTLEYLLIATREQVVRLSEQSETLPESRDLSEKIDELKNEIARSQNEKQNLQHQLLLYEKDISSLKRGIRKAENRNSLLDKESKQYQEMLAQLQFAICEQKRQQNHCEQEPYYEVDPGYKVLPQLQEQESNSELSLGKRVKRLFMNSI